MNIISLKERFNAIHADCSLQFSLNLMMNTPPECLPELFATVDDATITAELLDMCKFEKDLKLFDIVMLKMKRLMSNPSEKVVATMIHHFEGSIRATIDYQCGDDNFHRIYESSLKRMTTNTCSDFEKQAQGMKIVARSKEPSHKELQLGYFGSQPVIAKCLSRTEEIETCRALQQSGLSHASIVAFSLHEVSDNKLVMIMPRYPTTLSTYPDFTPRCAPAVEALVTQLTSALDHLHGLGYAHFDVKPSNICLSSEGVPVLVDLCSTVALGTRSFRTTGYFIPFDTPQNPHQHYEATPQQDFRMLAMTVARKCGMNDKYARMVELRRYLEQFFAGDTCCPAAAVAVTVTVTIRDLLERTRLACGPLMQQVDTDDADPLSGYAL